MTAQIPDILVHRGSSLALCDTPLDGYLEKLPKRRRPNFVMQSTACRRGYQATWEIRDQRLFLVALAGLVRDDGGVIEVDLATAFPWMRRPRFASWVDGELRCPEGRLIHYEHMGFGSEYERDRLFTVHRGLLVDELLRINPPRPVWYRLQADGTRRRLAGLSTWDKELPDPCLASEVPTWERFRNEPMFEMSADGEEEEGYMIAGCVSLPVQARSDDP